MTSEKSLIYKQLQILLQRINLVLIKIIFRQPEPDFSMPFNIMTFVCVSYGYYYLSIYKLAVNKMDKNLINEDVPLILRLKYIFTGKK